MIVKLLKNKDKKKNLSSSQRKETQYLQVSKSNREAGFETKTIEAEKQQDDIFNMLRADHCQLRTLRSVKTAFKNVCKEKKKHFQTNKT